MAGTRPHPSQSRFKEGPTSRPNGLLTTATRHSLGLLKDLNAANVSAGLTAVFFYAFGAIPVFLGVVNVLGLTAEQASSWFFIIFLTSAIASVPLTLAYRQPIPIGWTIPGLVFISTAGQGFTLPQIAGATVLTGVLLVLLGVLGVARRLLHWIPLPLVLGMFAGTILGYATGIFEHLGRDPIPVLATLLGYLGARVLNRPLLPPIAGAVALGLIAAIATQQVQPSAFQWGIPSVLLVRPEFTLEAAVTLVVPLVLMVVSMGNVPGMGLLVQQGFRPPANLITAVIGLATLVNAAFGGHQSTLQRVGTSILAGPDAGPAPQRYMSNIVASVGVVLLAFSATTAATLLQVLPLSLVASLAGLAILATLIESLRRTMTTDLSLGAFFAFVIAASPLTFLGIGSAFWALVGGMLVSLLVERKALFQAIRGGDSSQQSK